MKKETGERVGIESKIYELDEKITTKEMRKRIVELSQSSSIDGIIVELPLPEHINSQYVLNAIPENKDPDMLSQKAQGSFYVSRSVIVPPSVEAVRRIFAMHKIDPSDKQSVVFGYGMLIGRPVAHWLMSQGSTVLVINENTDHPGNLSSLADIVIAGADKPNIIDVYMLKTGSVVIDFGYEKVGDKILGNVDFESAKNKASLITPVPGGVGPIVIASALKNAVILAKNRM
jgi:methylenetetrahydrofolate dehydrogenase (NADP+)/methenyltetrahydrofolate cyclohydrolase